MLAHALAGIHARCHVGADRCFDIATVSPQLPAIPGARPDSPQETKLHGRTLLVAKGLVLAYRRLLTHRALLS